MVHHQKLLVTKNLRVQFNNDKSKKCFFGGFIYKSSEIVKVQKIRTGTPY